ncbi:MAG TPA: NAD-dependent epimerase/dehydratase family protein [Candidatus Limnocylindrales bacterium]|nr:NAD-dependent epimerase/dehydratase family protein [Candidatus Limnocylindrales bacterium]
MTPRRVLITGGAGFLGSHLARAFRREGVEVRLLDLEANRGSDVDPAVERIAGDVRDPRTVADAVDGIDVVVHAAFGSPRHPARVMRSVNVEGTRCVCERALAQGVRRVILISSTIVTKPARPHPILRDAPLSRLDAYRASRAEAEGVADEYRERGLAVAVVRPKTFVGPERVGAFAIIFEWIRLGRPVLVLGRGRNRYQLLDTRDMAEGIRLLAAAEAQGLFLFGARDFGTVREDFQVLLDHAGTGARLRFVPARLAGCALRGMELAAIVPLSEWHYMSAAGQDSVVDISRAERELGWRPQRSNAQALIEAYDWYVASIAATGAARTTHPVPLVHRALKGLSWILPR